MNRGIGTASQELIPGHASQGLRGQLLGCLGQDVQGWGMQIPAQVPDTRPELMLSTVCKKESTNSCYPSSPHLGEHRSQGKFLHCNPQSPCAFSTELPYIIAFEQNDPLVKNKG